MTVAEEVAIGVEIATGTVLIALDEKAENGVHATVVGIDELVVRCDGWRDELGNANLLNVGMVLESLLDIRHIGASAGKNDSTEELVGIVGRHLIPYILNDFVKTGLHNLNELAALNVAVAVDRIAEGTVDG